MTALNITADTKAHFVVTHIENGELVTLETYGDETLKDALCGPFNADAVNFTAHMNIIGERGKIITVDITVEAALVGWHAFYAGKEDDEGKLYAPGWVLRHCDDASDAVNDAQDRAYRRTRWVDDAYGRSREVA